MDEKSRSIIMLLLVGGPVIALIIAMSPGTRQPSPQTAVSNGGSGAATQSSSSASSQVDGREPYELSLRATVAAEAQAKWAKWQGIGGIVGVFAALVVLLYTHYTLQATAASVQTANQALLMEHRPRLMVRHVVVEGIDDETGLVTDRLNRGYASVTNVGAFDAVLVKFWADWLFARKLPLENPALKAQDTTTQATVMKPAAFVKLPLPDRTISMAEYIDINNNVESNRKKGRGTLYLVGYIKYQDSISLRRCYFCFEYNTASRYFTPVDHPSYSYED